MRELSENRNAGRKYFEINDNCEKHRHLITDVLAAADRNPETDAHENVETDDRKNESDFVKRDLALQEESCRQFREFLVYIAEEFFFFEKLKVKIDFMLPAKKISIF